MSKSRDDERQPLLAAQTASAQDESDPPQQKVQETYKAESFALRIFAPFEVIEKRFRFLPFVGCAVILMNEGEWFFKQTPYLRAIEAMYCMKYYSEVDPDIAKLGRNIPQRLCKKNLIQSKVAVTFQTMLLIRMVCALVSTVPLGWVGDRKGRKIVLLIHKFGTITFVLIQILVYLLYPKVPIWVLFFAGVGALIGGNFDLNLAMLFATYTDVMPSQRERTTLFFVTTAMQYVGQAIFPPLAAITMNLDGNDGTVNVSLYCSLFMAFAGLCVTILFIPETLGADGSMTKTQAIEPVSHPDQEMATARDTKSTKLLGKLKASVRSAWDNFLEGIAAIGLPNMLLFALSMLCTSIALKSIDWLGLVQYPVVKIGWKFSETNIILTTQALVYMVNYFLLLPFYNRLGKYFSLSVLNTSLCIMLMSSIVLITGSVLLGFTASSATFMTAMVVYTLGTGLPVVTQTYIANSIGKDRLGRVLAVFSLVSVGGKVAATGLGPAVFNAGLNAGNELLKGLIFWYSAGLFAVSTVAVSVVAMRSRRASSAAHTLSLGE